jgi:hypothetical protein
MMSDLQRADWGKVSALIARNEATMTRIYRLDPFKSPYQ